MDTTLKYREYCVNIAYHNIPIFEEMFSSSSSLQKCTKHTSINHILAAWCQHLWNKHCKTAPCQCITYFIEHYTKNSNSGSGQDK